MTVNKERNPRYPHIRNNLTEYHFPSDIKKMTDPELEILSAQIRDFLVDHVSKTGGHLASNLGVVELTIALHREFNSPTDKLIFDVGHQTYVHKILTGRAGKFDTLRQTGGLSGFPKAKESPHDAYDTGHASTSLSAAAGMAAARDLRGENYHIVATIGDGSLTGGLAYEALNNIGSLQSRVIIVLNDNGMSISRNTSGLSEHLGKLRVSSKYTTTKAEVKEKLNEIPVIGSDIAEGISKTKDSIKYLLMGGGILFEELGLTYLGPVDGHDIHALSTVLRQAKRVRGPVIVHVITKKGKGYPLAEEDPDRFHGIAPFDPNTGRLRNEPGQTYSSVFGKTLTDLAGRDNRIVAITAAMKSGTGLQEFARSYPARFFDVGIDEEHAVCFAAGLVKSGMRPVVAIYSSFLQRAYDQIMEDVCLQDLPVVFAIDRAGIVGADGETHHGLFDLSYLAAMPGLTILAPAGGTQLRQMLTYALTLDGPCAIRYPRGSAVLSQRAIGLLEHEQSCARPEPAGYTEAAASYGNLRLADGKDGDLWVVGAMLNQAADARAYLADAGIDIGIVDVRTLKPLDLSPLRRDVRRIYTLEDGVLTGGFGQRMRAALPESYSVRSFGWPDDFIEQGSCADLYRKYGLDGRSLAERIRRDLEKRKN